MEDAELLIHFAQRANLDAMAQQNQYLSLVNRKLLAARRDFLEDEAKHCLIKMLVLRKYFIGAEINDES